MSMDAEVEACLLRDPLRPHGPLSSLGSPLNYIDDASFGAKKDGKKMKWVEGEGEREQEAATQGHRQSRLLLRESLPEAAETAAASILL